MASRIVACPHCGAPVSIEPGARASRCTHCGRDLEAPQAPDRRPSTAIEDIREGAGILARRAVAAHLRERLFTLTRERDALWAQWQREAESALGLRPSAPASSPGVAVSIWAGCALILVGGLATLLGGYPGPLVALAGALLVGLGAALTHRVGTARRTDRRAFVRRALSDAENRFAPRIAALEAEIRSGREQLAQTEADLDRMARDL